ncbi:DUF2062 domain-containing protein [Porticoccaceae bacterium]|nr:DUF2062 domain-containing protein [Porticoccaceae bacterium]
MPKKFIRRVLPDFAALLKHKSMRWTVPLIRDPNILHLNRESVSLAVFIGILVAFLPLPGQTFIAAGLALWWGANLPLSILCIWISNPVTIAPIFFLTYRVGAAVLGSAPLDFSISLTWEWFSTMGAQIMLPLMVGSLLCGFAAAAAGYLLINFLWRWKVIRNWEKRKLARQHQQNNRVTDD